MNITARQLIKNDIGKIIEYKIWDSENMSDTFVSGTLVNFEHFTYRDKRLPATHLELTSIVNGEPSRKAVSDDTPITIQEGQ